jgi:hypothetical protein
MTLHEAMRLVLIQCPSATASFTYLSDEIWRRGLYRQKSGGKAPISQLKLRARNYPHLFNIMPEGQVQLVGHHFEPSDEQTQPDHPPSLSRVSKSAREYSDESYIIDLCDEVLNRRASRQQTFDFLRGDARPGRAGYPLPVDAYYSDLNLVIEYHERQHTEPVHHFDKPDVLTVSGVHRGEQRRLYDQKRRDILTAHSIKLVELSFTDFARSGARQLKRDKNADVDVLRTRLSQWVK